MTYIRFIRHVYDYFLTWCINKMANGSCVSIVKNVHFSDTDSHYYIIVNITKRKYFSVL